MAEVTKDEVKAALSVVMALSEAIRELGEVPSGHLYVQVMGVISMSDYESAIGLLKRTGLVEETGAHLLRWVGPKIPAS